MGRIFTHVQSTIGATDAEEVGVEHLLRDIKDASQGALSKRVGDKMLGLKVLAQKLKEMKEYLQDVVDGKLRYNQAIVNNF
jgi:26S proteasome regulatory subunit N8